MHVCVQGGEWDPGASVGRNGATALLPRGEGMLWGSHRGGIGFSHRDQSTWPDPSWMKHLRGCSPRLAVSLNVGEAACGSLASQAGLGHLRNDEASFPGFSVLRVRRALLDRGSGESCARARERRGI